MRGSRHRHPETPAEDTERDLTVAEATHEEQTLRARWEATQEALRDRFEQPIDRATSLTRKTLAWFPVRVWRHFLQRNGFLLAAGVSYQALFAIFATIYVAFAIAGLWLGGSTEAIDALIGAINSYIPGLIGDEGLFTTAQVTEIATSSSSVLGVTGIVALVTLIWTAIGFITFARRAVRDIFGIPPDRRSYMLLKARDLLASAIFGAALLVGSGLGFLGVWALNLVFHMLGWPTASPAYNILARAAALLVSFLLYSAALASLVKFLTGTSLKWRQIIPGAILGGAAITVLQLGAGWLLIYTPSNPLLATFAIFVGLLLWFRIIGVIILVASSWMAVATTDENLPILQRTEEERLAAEHAALLTAARVRLRSARNEAKTAPWYRHFAARRAVAEAEKELAEVEHAAPPPVTRGSLFE
ncbi:YihY/virulence factor BrkB family protein [Microbacterium aquimaris]|uniref:YihY/virulence factor BrkB family protein n=1 Tax=Microbacterium aquimaris TaxID=459816 RepID=A0ABU5N5Z8_9MICO|nr:YihY/virulence factor BrkB family protein [Microbacterium aquimaris]MDZ8161497.1 YihY/virulence factor BrkB family protein [Microbacterium aquimaris]